MPSVIEFLETMGRDPELRYATADQLEEALTSASIEPSVRTALVSGDARRLETLLGATAAICCMIRTPDEEEEEPQEEDDGEQPEEDGGEEEKA
jgi:hypothetical protein